jgi:sugar lactone lactonase YvrE
MSPVLVGKPDTEFRDCPGPPAAGDFSAHGIDLARSPDHELRLLVVNHGGRESIEVFRVSVLNKMPTLRWEGCVVFPSHLILNAVAPMPDGGFVVTSMLDRDDKDAFRKMISGGITGVVYRWRPGAPPVPLRGTEASVDNGIEVGPDGSIYVAAWGSKQVLRFRQTGSTLARESTSVDFLPDNLRWAPDGTLLVAGQRRDLTRLGEKCNGGPCSVAWAVARLDPKTMKATTFMEGDGSAFSEATTALEIGNEIWRGSASDTRIAIFPKTTH